MFVPILNLVILGYAAFSKEPEEVIDFSDL